jgi:hypothetical protein
MLHHKMAAIVSPFFHNISTAVYFLYGGGYYNLQFDGDRFYIQH